ncbi:MAG: cation diffusion facilitator family transporter [Clostridia bacterium]|nr:cation diffusion facilitator family transporter [Clostridia bacterium]
MTSDIGIVINLLLAILKVILGALASSIAIMSEGANNAADALSSVLTLIGTRLAGKHPDEKHPFGYKRIEYLTGLVVSLLILLTGIEMLISSVKLIFHPEELSVSYLSIIIIAVSAVVKFFLGIYTIRMGKKTGSSALEGVGMESRNDSFSSVITILSTLLFLMFGIMADAYAGILISAFIMKAGIDVLRETLSELIGRPGEKELADKLYREIRKKIHAFLMEHEHIKSFHALYLDPATRTLYCDFVVDYALRDWDGLRTEFTEYVKEQYPDFKAALTIETEYV